MVRCNRYPKPRFVGDANTGEAATNSLPNDMWKAFLNETSADLTITCETFNDEATDENEQDVIEQTPARATFKVQKGILTSRSEIFAAMFSHRFSEGETSTIHITDMSPQVRFLVILVHFGLLWSLFVHLIHVCRFCSFNLFDFFLFINLAYFVNFVDFVNLVDFV